MVKLLKSNSAVFLDRDGVLNHCSMMNGKPSAPRNYLDFRLYDGALDNLKLLKEKDFLTIVITNQPDIGNGITSLLEVQKMNQKLLNTQLIDKIYMCIHSQKDNCLCRKPGTKMLFDAKNDFNIDLSSSWLIGDRWSDISAGYNAGVRSVFIDYKYPESVGRIQSCIKVKDLKTAVTKIITH